VPVLEQVIEKYPEKVKVVFKNYPLIDHQYAQPAAAAALAAEKQGKFWEFHDLLFKNCRQLDPKKIKDIALELGLDADRLQKDMQDATVLASINRDVSEAARAGVWSVPTVFINGRILRDGTLVGFQALIEKELKKAETRISRFSLGQARTD